MDMIFTCNWVDTRWQ